MRSHHQEGELRRLSLTIPASLHHELTGIVKEENLTYVGVIRTALQFWLEVRKAKKMEEGYIAYAEENLKLMEEFKHVDREVW